TDELPAARETAKRELSAARDRAAEVDRTAADLARRFLAEPRVVVGTPLSPDADPVFAAGDRGPDCAPPFGLLVLDRAEELTEPDFLRLAKLAGRWVLVGDVAGEPGPHRNGPPSRHGPGRNGRAGGAAFAARLARALDRETWAYEADRLVCRLAHP